MSIERRLSPVGGGVAPLPPAAVDRRVRRRVLVVDGDQETRDSTAVALLEAGFEVSVAGSGAAALLALHGAELDLIVLSALLPDRSGIDVLREIRVHEDVPVIILGPLASEADRVLCLEIGADDYVTKPVSAPELLSRGRAILRRRPFDELAASVRSVGALRIDPARHEVTLGECSVAVTASEFRLLALLSGSPGTVFTRRQIMEHLWAGPYFGDGHPVDAHVLNLRRKLEPEPSRPRRLLTVRGVGFKLVVPEGEPV